MGESSDLIGVSKYILEEFGNDKCNDLSYSAMVTTLLESKYTGGISKPKYALTNRISFTVNYLCYSATMDFSNL